jgi:hypothetical protein
MPRPLSNEAPRWDGRDADGLREFIYQLERLFETCKINDDKDKLKWAVSYLNSQTRIEWMGFPEFSDPQATWAGFLERLKKEYPELVTSEQGSVRALNRICDQYRPISLGSEDQLLAFKRRFTIEANKCLKDPPIISNRELVDKFIQTLDDDFRNLLDQRLALVGGSRTDARGQPINANDLREEDPYDWTTVADTAVKLVSGKTLHRSLGARGSQPGVNPSSSIGAGQPITKKELFAITEGISNTLAQELAAIKDTIGVQEKNFKAYIDSIKGSTSNSRGPVQSTGNTQYMNRQNCFYCGKEGHGWAFCPSKDEDIQAGRIYIDGNRAYFADKTPIPRGEGPIRKRVME